MVQLDQFPNLPDPTVSNDDYFVSLNWCPGYQVGRIYGDLGRSPSLGYRHNNGVRFRLNFLPCRGYCLCSVALKLNVRR